MNDKPLLVPITLNVLLLGNPGIEKTLSAAAFQYRLLGKDCLFGNEIMAGEFSTVQEYPGAHLQWILPDALLHGVQGEDGELSFPEVPNRWYIVRMRTNGGLVESRAWLVRSDVISAEKEGRTSEGMGKTALPALAYDDKKGYWVPAGDEGAYYHFIGDVVSAEDEMKEKDSVEKLSAVGMGDHLFSAMYPNSKTVFGFYDSMKNIQTGTFTYLVCGYYAREESDPFYGNETMSGDNNLMGWTWKGAEKPRCMLCHGAVSKVEWMGREHCYQSQESLKGDLVLAATSAEALSAYIQEKMPEAEGIERILYALQSGLIPELDNENLTDRIISMEDKLHQRSFQYVAGGERMNIKKCSEKSDELTISLSRESRQRFIGLKDKLKKLNRAARTRADLEERAYLLWCKYIKELNDFSFDGTPVWEAELEEALNALSSAEQTISDSSREIKTESEELDRELEKTGLRLSLEQEDFFVRPTAPAIMFVQKDEERTYQQGFQSDEDGTLRCRTEAIGRIEAVLEGEKIPLEFADLERHVMPVDGIALPDFVKPIFIETILLGQDFSDFLAERLLDKAGSLNPAKDMEKARQAVEEARNGEDNAPSMLALRQWSMPWHPLLLEWRMKATSPCGSTDETALDYYTLGDIDLEPAETGKPAQRSLDIHGKTLLTPHAPMHLKKAVEELKDTYQEGSVDYGKLEAICSRLESRQILSQQLEGFTETFRGVQYSASLPILPLPEKEDTGRYAARVQQILTGIHPMPYDGLPEDYFMAVQGGYIEPSKLRLIDSFGQYRDISLDDGSLIFGESMRAEEKDRAVLPARFLNGVRLNWEWISAEDNTAEAVNEDTSPVLGFILCDYLNMDMQIYDADGVFLGWLYPGTDGSAAWKENPWKTAEEQEKGLKPKLKALLDSMKEWSAHQLEMLLSEIDRYFSSKIQEKHALSGVENLIAIVGGSLEVEQYGLPVEFWGGERNNSHKYEWGEFTIRIGDMRKNQDGVIGFFEDSKDQENRFQRLHLCRAVQNDLEEGKVLLFNNELRFSLRDFAEDGMQKFVFFLDPYKELTVRTGILPVKELRLNAELYEKQTQKIQPYILAAPVITSMQQTALPISRLKGKQLSYVETAADGRKIVQELQGTSAETLTEDSHRITEGYLTWKET
ncbi:MAG: hypothetical protein Q4C91_06085 [Eubacteriales bacterium]|nr:hypothetical protein [Eubacteriales bacterium]